MRGSRIQAGVGLPGTRDTVDRIDIWKGAHARASYRIWIPVNRSNPDLIPSLGPLMIGIRAIIDLSITQVC